MNKTTRIVLLILSILMLPIIPIEIIPEKIDEPTPNTVTHLNKVVSIDRTESMDLPSRGNRTKTMTATYYTWTGNKTKTGTWPEEGRTVAVDPEVIPLGSRLIIDGVGGYIAEDTGGVIQSNKIDIYKTSRNECINLGIKIVNVQIIN